MRNFQNNQCAEINESINYFCKLFLALQFDYYVLQGKIHDLEDSGLTLKYVKKDNYGETPTYLTKRKEEAEQQQEEYDQYVKESMRKGAMKELSGDER